MTAPAIEILIIFGLVALNGVFALAEIAIVASRKSRLQRLADEGDRRAERALALANSPGDFLSTVQVGITLVGVLAGAFGGATIAEELSAAIAQNAILSPYADTIGILLVVAGISYLSLIVGELVPKRIALGNPEKFAALVAVPISRLSGLSRPLVRVLSLSSDFVLWMFRVRPVPELPVTEEEVRSMIRQGTAIGVFEKAEEEMVDNVFRLSNRRVGALMTPRKDVVSFATTDTATVILQRLRLSRHSQYPLCEGSLDSALGVVSTTDVLTQVLSGAALDLRAIVRDVPNISQATSALKALDILEKSKCRFSFVVNEFGGIQGIISVSDIVGAVAGFAPRLEVPAARRRSDGSWLVDGMLSFEELRRLFPSLPDSGGEQRGFTTVGGFIFDRLGRIPAEGDIFVAGGFLFEVLDMDGLRVDKVSIRPAGAGEGPEPSASRT